MPTTSAAFPSLKDNQQALASLDQFFEAHRNTYINSWHKKVRMPLQIALFISPLALFNPGLVADLSLTPEDLMMVRFLNHSKECPNHNHPFSCANALEVEKKPRG